MQSIVPKITPVYSLQISPQTFYGKVIDHFKGANEINHIGRRINSRHDKASRLPLKEIYDYDPDTPRPKMFPYSEFTKQKLSNPKFLTDDDYALKVQKQADKEQVTANDAYDKRKRHTKKISSIV